MRFILITSLFFSLQSLAMDDNGHALHRYFDAQLGRYVGEDQPPRQAASDVDDVQEIAVAGDDAETSRYNALAPTEDDSSEEEKIDDDVLDLFNDRRL